MAEKGPTSGHVFNMGDIAPGTRIYFKPSLPKMIYRKAGLIRRSEKVLAINKKLEDVRGTPRAPATICKGRPWKEFIKCLRAEMKKLVG